MNSEELKKLMHNALPIIERFSPIIGSAIGGIPGFALGHLIPLLAKTFGADPNDPNDVANAILSDSNAGEKLKALEAEHCDSLCQIMKNLHDTKSAELSITWKN